jgi:hypothetical protein
VVSPGYHESFHSGEASARVLHCTPGLAKARPWPGLGQASYHLGQALAWPTPHLIYRSLVYSLRTIPQLG